MAEYESDFNDDEEIADEDGFEPDPATVAYLDQQSAEFEATKDDFAAIYGFTHDCVCAADYAEGRVETVTRCFLGLVDDALEACARMNWESQMLQGMLSETISVNDKLREIVGEDAYEEVLVRSFEDIFEEGEDDDEDEF